MRREIAENLVVGVKEGHLVLVNITTRERGEGEFEFTMSANEVRPFIITQRMLEDRAKDVIDDLRYSDPKTLIDYLEDYDCKWSDLPEEIAENWEMEELFDISLYPESVSLGRGDVYFESGGCGQTGLEDVEFIDENFGKFIKMLWDGFHLREVPQALVTYLEEIVDSYYEVIVDTDTWIEDYVRRNQHNL